MMVIIMENLRKKFWLKIANLRKDKKLSQERLGFLSKIHRTYISEIERWEANITLEHIGKLALALWVDLSDLFKL
jgi:transcriptional regulator with XRE-family HTH domain